MLKNRRTVEKQANQAVEPEKLRWVCPYPFDVFIKFLQQRSEIQNEADSRAARKIRALKRKLDKKYGYLENW